MKTINKITEKIGFDKYLIGNDWNKISSRTDLPIEFIRHYKDKLNGKLITFSYFKELSNDFKDKFIDEFKDKLNWTTLTRDTILTEEFIDKYYNYVD